jgi:hypothetical protein
MDRGKRGSALIARCEAAASVIHAGRQANEPSGWWITTKSTPPLMSRRRMSTVSPKRG